MRSRHFPTPAALVPAYSKRGALESVQFGDSQPKLLIG